MGRPQPPLEPIRIIIKITRRSLWPWLHFISIRSPSLSSSGHSETSFGITCLALCLGEHVATATSPSGDISAVDICLFVCLRLSLCLRLRSASFSSASGSKSSIQIPDSCKSGGLYTPGPQDSLGNRDTLASSHKTLRATNKKNKSSALPFYWAFYGC